MDLQDILRAKRDEILQIAERHGARNVRVFGSAALGEAHDGSDIDFLVATSEKTSPWFPPGSEAGGRVPNASSKTSATDASPASPQRRRLPLTEQRGGQAEPRRFIILVDSGFTNLEVV